MNEYFKLESCLLCGSARLSDLDGYHENFLVKCRDCNFVFCNRKPSIHELTNHYEQYLRGRPISPITLRRYQDLCRRFEKYRRSNNILDVGCGDGHFLAVARENGWNVFGTESTDRAIEIGRQKGIQMTKGALQTVPFNPAYFDIITSFEVIEHLNNPREEAASMAKLLRPGGLLYVTTPNFNSLSRMLLGPRWNIIEYPEHLCYFTERTLLKLFQSSGFGTSSITSTGFSVDRMKRSSSPVGAETGKMDEILRQKTEGNFLLLSFKNFLNFFLGFFEKGDGLKASFIRQ